MVSAYCLDGGSLTALASKTGNVKSAQRRGAGAGMALAICRTMGGQPTGCPCQNRQSNHFSRQVINNHKTGAKVIINLCKNI